MLSGLPCVAMTQRLVLVVVTLLLAPGASALAQEGSLFPEPVRPITLELKQLVDTGYRQSSTFPLHRRRSRGIVCHRAHRPCHVTTNRPRRRSSVRDDSQRLPLPADLNAHRPKPGGAHRHAWPRAAARTRDRAGSTSRRSGNPERLLSRNRHRVLFGLASRVLRHHSCPNNGPFGLRRSLMP